MPIGVLSCATRHEIRSRHESKRVLKGIDVARRLAASVTGARSAPRTKRAVISRMSSGTAASRSGTAVPSPVKDNQVEPAAKSTGKHRSAWAQAVGHDG